MEGRTVSTNDSNRDPTKLERFAALVRSDATDVESMNDAQLAQYLKESKIALAQPQKRFAALLQKAHAKRKLEIAKVRRLAAIEKAKEVMSAGPEALDAVRQRVKSMIDKFGEHNPEQALVYAREFEKATPEDLQVLEQDLLLLEMEQADDKGNE